MYDDFYSLVHDIYKGKDKIFLHEPVMCGSEKKYVLDAIESTFVSSENILLHRNPAAPARIDANMFVAYDYVVFNVDFTGAEGTDSRSVADDGVVRHLAERGFVTEVNTAVAVVGN